MSANDGNTPSQAYIHHTVNFSVCRCGVKPASSSPGARSVADSWKGRVSYLLFNGKSTGNIDMYRDLALGQHNMACKLQTSRESGCGVASLERSLKWWVSLRVWQNQQDGSRLKLRPGALQKKRGEKLKRDKTRRGHEPPSFSLPEPTAHRPFEEPTLGTGRLVETK